jgi:short subunit dehydrogenase-like uncharacterized protein
MERDRRAFDLIVFGATGYTGRLVANEVHRRAPPGLRWAVAGRDPGRLATVAREVGDVPTVVADAADPESLAALAASTRVVATTVGPYARYGTPLVAACVAAGTDYADLTGESTWIRTSIDAFDDAARAAHVRIVHACGFDSVPSDLGVALLQEEATRRTGRPAASVVHAFGPMSGGVSGGTIASAFDLADQVAGDPSARAALADPELLAPGGARSNDPLGPLRPLRHRGLPGWTAPFVMAPANGKVVRRSRYLLGEPWGDGMRYLERLAMPTWARAAALTAGMGVAVAALALGPTRRLAERILPSPGEGPSRRTRERGFFRSTLVGYDAAGVPTARLGVHADRDPGYGATAGMLTAMALFLADPHERPGHGPGRGGVLTPAVAGGQRYADRLARAGVRFDAAPPSDAARHPPPATASGRVG